MIKKIETVWVTGQFQALAPWEPGQEAEFHSISFLTRIVHQWYSLSLLFPKIPAVTPLICCRTAGRQVSELFGHVLQHCHVTWCSAPPPRPAQGHSSLRGCQGAGITQLQRADQWPRWLATSSATQSVYVPCSPATQESVNSPHIYSAFLSLQEVKSCHENKAKKALMGKRFRLPSRIASPAFFC